VTRGADGVAVPPLWDLLERHSSAALLCALAFDGVLADYHPDPMRVTLTEARRRRLRRLSEIPGVAVAVVSGRPLADLASRVDLGPRVFYIGAHGIEMVGPHVTRQRSDPSPHYRRDLHGVLYTLLPVIARAHGARLEEKGAVLALHTHGMDAADAICLRAQFLDAARHLLRTKVVRPMRGRDVLELLPNVGRPGAEAIADLRRLLAIRVGGSVFAAYVGADIPDDDARDSLDDAHVSVVVGRRGGWPYRLAAVAEVDDFLDRLIAQRSRCGWVSSVQ